MFKKMLASAMVISLLSSPFTAIASEVVEPENGYETVIEDIDSIAIIEEMELELEVESYDIEPIAEIEEGIEINATNFPDQVLRYWLMGTLWSDKDGNGWLSKEEIENITYIKLSGIRDFTGMEHLVNLESIIIYAESVNEDVKLDFSVFHKLEKLVIGTDTYYDEMRPEWSLVLPQSLESLQISYAKIKSLNLEELNNLTSLEITIDDASQTKLDLKNHPHLEELLVSGDLKNLDLKDGENLQVLFLFGESIKDKNLDLTYNKNLESAYIMNDQVQNLDVSYLTKLKVLNVSGSNIANIDITGCTNLDYLKFDDSNITQIDISTNTELTGLSMAYTNISELDLSNHTKLEELDVTCTKIAKLDLSNTAVEILSAGSSYLEEIILPPNSEMLSYIDAGITTKYDDYEELTISTLQKEDSLVLPDSVTQIGYRAFVGNNTPSLLEFPDKIERISELAIIDSTSLNTMVINNEEQWSGMFVDNCPNFTEIFFRGQVLELEGYLAEELFNDMFSSFSGTIYYPQGDAEWEKHISYYSGDDIDWIPWDTTLEVVGKAPEPENPSILTVVTSAEVKDEIAVAQVDSNKVIEQLTEELSNLDGVIVEVEIKSDGVIKSLEVKLEDRLINELAGKHVPLLKILSELVELTFDDTAITAIKEQTKGTITFKATWVDVNTLNDDAKALIGDRTVLDFTITDEYGTEVTDFNGGIATIKLPYTLQSEEVADKVIGCYVTDGDVEVLESVVYEEDTLTIETTHFSIYGIGYEVSTSGNGGTGTGGTGTGGTGDGGTGTGGTGDGGSGNGGTGDGGSGNGGTGDGGSGDGGTGDGGTGNGGTGDGGSGDGGTGDGGSGDGESGDDGSQQGSSPKTSDSTNILIYITAMVLALGFAASRRKVY